MSLAAAPTLPSLTQLESAAELVHRFIPPTPQFSWPLLNQQAGCEVWVKHENHTPIGAFKVRGGIVYMDWLRRTHPQAKGVISATRGNHGQSQAFAAHHFGFHAVVVVPRGNSREKNSAMRALGAELVEHGDDFHAADHHADELCRDRGLVRMPSFDPLLVQGVASYALELFRGAPPLDAVFVPIGWGSGACGLTAVRNALNLKPGSSGWFRPPLRATRSHLPQDTWWKRNRQPSLPMALPSPVRTLPHSRFCVTNSTTWSR